MTRGLFRAINEVEMKYVTSDCTPHGAFLCVGIRLIRPAYHEGQQQHPFFLDLQHLISYGAAGLKRSEWSLWLPTVLDKEKDKSPS